MEHVNTSPKKVNGLLGLIIVMFSFLAICGYGRMTNLLAAGFMAIFVALVALTHRMVLIGDRGKSVAAFMLFFVYQVLVSFVNNPSMYYFLTTNILWTLVMFTPLFMGYYVLQCDDIKSLKRLFIGLTAVWFFIVCYSIVVFMTEEEGGRAFVQDSKNMFIGGGYPIAYGCAIFAAVLMLFVTKDSPKGTRALLLLALILCCLHVFVTQSVITIAALILGLAMALVFRGQKRGRTTKWKVALIFGVTLAVILNLEPIGKWLIAVSKNVENAVFAQRIEEMGLFLYSDTETKHVGLRFDTLTDSLTTFLRNPIFGVSYQVGNYFDLLHTVGVGTHSEIFDTLAKYGVLGAVPFFAVYYYQIKAMVKSTERSIVIPLLAVLLVLMAFNPFTSAQTNFMLFLYLPLFLRLQALKKAEG